MSPTPSPTAASITFASSDDLQSQNNTIQLIAVVFAVVYGIPLMFAAYIQWKTYLVARGRNDLEHQRTPLVMASKGSKAGPSDLETETFDRHVSDSHTKEDDNFGQHATDCPDDASVMSKAPREEDNSNNESSASRLT
ncbi:MAG: hypothetical protein Q9174_006003 [Haloplaca sp. 1 TL-2023]